MDFIFDNNVPIYIQLVEQLKLSIISGKIKPGERIPSVRELALQMKVNPNTMQKALVELENLKLVYTERTNGKYVTSDEKLILKVKKEFARKISKKYVESMKEIGFSEKDTVDYLKKMEVKK